MPSSLTHSTPSCWLTTRGPGGEPQHLFAGEPPAWARQAPALAGLPVREALERVRRTPGGLLVGVLPYPAARPDPDPTPATLYLFDRFRQQPPPPATGPQFRLTRPFSADWSADGYRAGVRRVQEYLAAGDAYQVNLARRYSARCSGDPRHAYAALQTRFRPPFSAYVDMGDRQVLCLSPESFLEVDGRSVRTRPIKGTRPRGADPASDRELAQDLLSHPKDRAENLMIVDLLRNDLGKVCVPGSVQVPALFELESQPNVHHLVSTVSGTLAPGTDLADLLLATFPGGSITGAPKRRAMELIDELEPHPRDIYCGSIFWALADGRFGSNIAIRTFLVRNGSILGWAGAGIVADSVPETEEAECRHKLQPLMRALELMI